MDAEIIKSLNEFVKRADILLKGSLLSAYCYGSAVYGDFHCGYSDLDFFLLAKDSITAETFSSFSLLRAELKASGSPYLSVLEGEIISQKAIKNDTVSNVIYWGTKSEKLNNRYNLSGFSLRGLIDNGYLIYGYDLRKELPYPEDKEMLAKVDSMIETVKTYARTVNDNVHSIDWLFLICQSIYWLKTRNITGKTNAAKWMLENYSYEWTKVLNKAIFLRQNPMLAESVENRTWIRNLGDTIQYACKTLQNERWNLSL
ncbi:MAG TPA: aminoglycoside adenylyltransferase domain-containing protein [Clostridia bacterium]|nr:aminoglycoside adenylyltransferase domain-containing protein [Clostridia bacterium]